MARLEGEFGKDVDCFADVAASSNTSAGMQRCEENYSIQYQHLNDAILRY